MTPAKHARLLSGIYVCKDAREQPKWCKGTPPYHGTVVVNRCPDAPPTDCASVPQ